MLRVVIALRRIKAERDLSDRAMAIQTNVSYAFFKDIMDNGGNPSILVLDDMARRLGVTIATEHQPGALLLWAIFSARSAA